MDTGGEFLVNALMTGGASGGQVLGMSGGLLLGAVQDEMAVVAIGADGAGEQSFLDQAAAVDGAGVVHQDTVFRVFLLRPLQLTMAAPAELGNVGPVGLIALVEVRHDLVFAVTIRAIRRLGGLLHIVLTVSAIEIIFGGLRMTIGAIHPTGRFAGTAPLRVDVGMTLHAGNISMHGVLDVLFQDGQGDLLAFRDLVNVRFFVAPQTFPVGRAQNQPGPFDFMGMMAIGTGGDCADFFFPELPFDDLDVDFFDPGVALSAGPGDVPG